MGRQVNLLSSAVVEVLAAEEIESFPEAIEELYENARQESVNMKSILNGKCMISLFIETQGSIALESTSRILM